LTAGFCLLVAPFQRPSSESTVAPPSAGLKSVSLPWRQSYRRDCWTSSFEAAAVIASMQVNCYKSNVKLAGINVDRRIIGVMDLNPRTGVVNVL
jgi:hypothetical protein